MSYYLVLWYMIWLYKYCLKSTFMWVHVLEAARRRYFCKICRCQGIFCNKVADRKPANLLKKRLRQKCFTKNFAKCLRTGFFYVTSKRLFPIFVKIFSNCSYFANRRSLLFLWVCFYELANSYQIQNKWYCKNIIYSFAVVAIFD